VAARRLGVQHGENSMVNLRNIAGILCVLTTLHAAPTRAADQDIARRFQLQTQFSLASVGISAQTDSPLAVHAGLGCCNAWSTTSSLIPISGVGVGYAVDEHWVPSLSASFSYPQFSSTSKHATIWSVQPGLSYVFAAGESARPFARVALAYGRANLFDGYRLGAHLTFGTQLHVAAQISIDPFVELAYDYSHVTETRDIGFNIARSNEHDVSLRGGFALSAWL
jgi:hypothetical protein